MRSPSSPCSGRGAFGSVVSHFGPADGGEQHRVGTDAGGLRLVGQRDPVRVDRGAAVEVLLELELSGRDRLENRDRRAGQLWADSVAGEEDDVVDCDGCGR